MSIESVINCDLQSLNLDQIIRLVTYVDDEGQYYIHFVDDGVSIDDLTPCSECAENLSMLQLFKMALVEDADGYIGLLVC